MGKAFSPDRLVDYLHQNIFVKDTQGVYIFCNLAYAQLLGIEADAIAGKNDYDFFPKEIAEKYREDDRAIVEEGVTVDAREEIVVDGEVWTIKSVKKPVYDDEGNITAIVGIFWDITETVRRENELTEIKEGLKQAQQLAKIGHWELNLVKNTLYWSDEVYRIFGLKPQEFGATYEAFLNYVHPDDVALVNEAYTSSVANKSGYHITHRIVRHDGSVGFVEERCTHDFDEEGSVIRSIGTVHDISERKEQEKELALAGEVFKNINDGIIITDPQQNIIQANAAFLKISGYSREEVIGKRPNILSSGWHDELFYAEMWRSLEINASWEGEILDRRKNGELYVAELVITAVKDENGNLTNYIAITSDITERKEKEKQIRNLAYYDPLTQLPNRVLFKERVEQRLHTAKRKEQILALFFFDLDNFKMINDTMGHIMGDELLKAVAERVSTVLREEDSLSRLGGDEFTVMLENVQDLSQLTTVANKILSCFHEPFSVEGKEIYSACSIGISTFPDDGGDFDSLIKAADTAMYHVKDGGKNSYQFFMDEMNVKAMQRLRIENDLRNALSKEEFFLVYQPKIDLKKKRVYGMEALIRWKHTERGMIWPDQFIPVAEETGLIYEIGLWVLQQALEDTLKLHQKGFDDLVVSVNVSSVQLKNDLFVDDVLAVIEKTGIECRFVELEITESALVHDIESVLEKLERLHANNIHLAIDDFGTGYSSLSYLKKFPVHTLKIDKSFILDIDKDPDDRSITTAIIAMAKSLNLNIIAEGSETQEHIDVIRELGCHQVQGYFFGKPMPYAEFLTHVGECKVCEEPLSSCLDCNVPHP